MGSKLRKEDIIEKVNELGIYLEDGIKWTNDKMIKKLGDFFIDVASTSPCRRRGTGGRLIF